MPFLPVGGLPVVPSGAAYLGKTTLRVVSKNDILILERRRKNESHRNRIGQ